MQELVSYDMQDGTLVGLKSRAQFPVDEHDWRFFNKKVPKELQNLHENGYKIVIFRWLKSNAHHMALLLCHQFRENIKTMGALQQPRWHQICSGGQDGTEGQRAHHKHVDRGKIAAPQTQHLQAAAKHSLVWPGSLLEDANKCSHAAGSSASTNPVGNRSGSLPQA